MAEVRRVVVLGGTGFFGRAVAGRLGALGLKSITASRRAGAGIRIDAESRASLKSTLRPFDVVVDAAGPFQSRGTALVEAAIETGFDVIDLSDSLGYAEKVADLRLRIEAAGIRVLTSCSSVSTLSALAIRLSGFEDPARLSVFLLPAARFTANRGTSRSLLRSVGAPIRVRRDGRLVERAGWSESRTFEMPRGGRVRGFLCECSDGLLLPLVWPGLWRVDFYVRSGVPLLDSALVLAARSPAVRRLIETLLPAGLVLSRLIGTRTGCLVFEVERHDGSLWSLALAAPADGYFAAVAPAVLAARAIAQGRFERRGLVPPDRHVEPQELLDYLQGLGIDVITTRHGRREG